MMTKVTSSFLSQLVEFCAEDIDSFEPSSKDGRMFVNAEEMQLLHHAIEELPYKPVNKQTNKQTTKAKTNT